MTIAQVCQRLAISEQTLHRWRNQYGGLEADEAKRLKELEAENARLKRLVAEVITAIDEKKTPTEKLFRKVLRRKLAEGGPLLTFTVRRSGKTMDVTLPVKE